MLAMLLLCFGISTPLRYSTKRPHLIPMIKHWSIYGFYGVRRGLWIYSGSFVRSFVLSFLRYAILLLLLLYLWIYLSSLSVSLTVDTTTYHTTYRNRIKYFSFSYISLFCSVSYLSIVASVVKRIIWKWEMIFHDILWNEWSLLCCILHKTYYWEWGVKMSIKSK